MDGVDLLYTLITKFPTHNFRLDNRDVYCDEVKICTLPNTLNFAPVTTGGRFTFEDFTRLLEIKVKLMEDPTYYDYEKVRDRRSTPKLFDGTTEVATQTGREGERFNDGRVEAVQTDQLKS